LSNSLDVTTIMSASALETRRIARRLAESLPAGEVALLLIGELGAGKTTFVQGLAAGLNVKGQIASPSFLLMREYDGARPLRHIDLYRLQSAEQLEPLGVFEDIPADCVVVVEWADRFRLELNMPSITVEFRLSEHETMRELRLAHEGFANWELKDALFTH
jgi:tRNA threonylcarbamoyladenosine biosynthesis protein TsaE